MQSADSRYVNTDQHLKPSVIAQINEIYRKNFGFDTSSKQTINLITKIKNNSPINKYRHFQFKILKNKQ